MFVQRFEGSWLRHPFWWARFVVKTEKALDRIRDSGVELQIDTDKGIDVTDEAGPAGAGARAVAPAPAPKPAPVPAVPARTRPAYLGDRSLIEPAPWQGAAKPGQFKKLVAPAAFGKADKVRAQALAQRSTKVVKALFNDSLSGGSVPAGQILSVVDDIASTLERNGSAFLNVTRLKSKDDGLYTHSVAVCALMIGLARELGMPPHDVQALGTAGLLHDVGKVRIDDALLQKKDGLTDAELVEIRSCPQIGFDMLMAEDGLVPVARDVALHHQERLDGSGYPFAHKGEEISQAARMAAICDTYEMLTSAAGDAKALAPAEAIAAMQAMGDALDGTLLFKFMRSIGVFPAKMVVRLRSNRLALVLPSQGEDRRTTVRAFYSSVETRFINQVDAVLSDSLSDDQAMSEEDPTRWFAGNWETMCAAITAGKPLTPAMMGVGAAA